MSILQISAIKIGQEGVSPTSFKMLSDDSLGTILLPGYLSQGINGQSFANNDIIEVVSSYGKHNALNSQVHVSLNGDGTLSLNLLNQNLTTTVSLNQSQILNAFSSAALLIPAFGPGTVIIVNSVIFYLNFQISPFSGGGQCYVQWTNTVPGSNLNPFIAIISSSDVNQPNSQIDYVNTFLNNNGLTGITNQGIYFTNDTGPFMGGSPSSTLDITLNYQIINAIV